MKQRIIAICLLLSLSCPLAAIAASYVYTFPPGVTSHRDTQGKIYYPDASGNATASNIDEARELIAAGFVPTGSGAGLSPIGADTLLGNNTGSTTTPLALSVAQVKALLGYSKADIGLGSVPNLDFTNPANIIQDSTHRFASDAEKSAWNDKLNPSGSGASLTGITAAQVGAVATTALPGLFGCQVLDTAICRSAVDASGDPNFFATSSTTTLTIKGTATPLVGFIAGVQQRLTADVTLSLGSGHNVQYFVLAIQDLINTSLVAGDFFATTAPPISDFKAPPCPIAPQNVSLSSTNPAIWFNLTDGTTMACTSDGGVYALTTPMLQLGSVGVDSTPKIDTVDPDPYRLSPSARRRYFGDGSGGLVTVTSGTVNLGALNAMSGFSIASGGANCTNGSRTLTLACGATLGVTVTSNAVATINSVTNAGNSCVSGTGQSTTGAGCTTPATITIAANGTVPTVNQVAALIMLGGTAQYNAGSNPFTSPGQIILSQNGIINKGSISAQGLGKFPVGITGGGQGSAATAANGGTGGIGGGGGGSDNNIGGWSGCREKMQTGDCSDAASGGAATNAAGANASSVLVPLATSPLGLGGLVRFGAGTSGGAGAGNGTNRGGDGGPCGTTLTLKAPSIYNATGASITAAGANGSATNSVSGDSCNVVDVGGGGGGGGGTLDLSAGFWKNDGTITAVGGDWGRMFNGWPWWQCHPGISGAPKNGLLAL